MGFLDELQQPDHPRRRDADEFSRRYERGRPDEGYDGQEVARRYNEVAGHADKRTVRKAAHQALGRMDSTQRSQFGQLISQQAQQRGISADFDGSDDTGVLADLTAQVHDQDPGLLGGLLSAAGGGSSGSGGSTGGVVGSVLGGGSEGVVGSMVGGLAGDNPIAKAALAGITSYATKSLVDR